MNKYVWMLFVTLAIGVGLYPSIYLFLDKTFGLLSTKPTSLFDNICWNMAFYIHIAAGGIALLIGWTQFRSKFRNKNIALHKKIGKLYLFTVLISSLSGIYIGFYATGGIVTTVGFVTLGIFWLISTSMAYWEIKNGNVIKHQNLMIYSYAACFAAVMLRLWLPILSLIFGDFITAYRMVAWLCWVPNIIIARLIIRRLAINQII